MYVSPPFDGPVGGPRYTPTSSTANGELRRITGTLHARPGALVMLVVVPGDALASVTLGGRALDVATLQRGHGDTRVLRIHGPPAAGLEIVAELRGGAPWVLADMLPGLTEASAQLVARRPVDRVPYQTGDLRIALRSFTP